jgi:hypothetical protein
LDGPPPKSPRLAAAPTANREQWLALFGAPLLGAPLFEKSPTPGGLPGVERTHSRDLAQQLHLVHRLKATGRRSAVEGMRRPCGRNAPGIGRPGGPACRKGVVPPGVPGGRTDPVGAREAQSTNTWPHGQHSVSICSSTPAAVPRGRQRSALEGTQRQRGRYSTGCPIRVHFPLRSWRARHGRTPRTTCRREPSECLGH